MSDNATLRRLLREHAEAVSTEIAIIKEDAILRLFDAVQNEYAAQVAELQTALREANEDAAFHPRAAKLMRKRKNFIVIACDESYFMEAYDLIRDFEMQKGTWTIEDQWHYDDAKVAHRARVDGAS